MLELASAKGVYKTLEEHELGDGDNFPQQFKNKFDICIVAGLINGNHLDQGIIEEMIMATKQNGLLVFSARFSYMGNYWYNFYMRDQENDGRIKKLKTKDFFKYDTLGECIGKFAKTPSRAYAYKNLCPEINGYKVLVVEDKTFSAFTKDD